MRSYTSFILGFVAAVGGIAALGEATTVFAQTRAATAPVKTEKAATAPVLTAPTATARATAAPRATSTAAQAATLPLSNEETCTNTSNDHCYRVRHDFSITVPTRPDIATLEAQVGALDKTYKETEATLAAINANLADLDKKIAAERAKLSAFEADAQATQNATDDATKKKHDEAVANAAKERALLDQLDANRTKLVADLGTAQNKLADTKKAMDDARQKVIHAKGPIDVALTGSGFIAVSSLPLTEATIQLFTSLDYWAAKTLPNACQEPTRGYIHAKSVNLIVTAPDQPGFFCDEISIASGEIVQDRAHHPLPSQEFNVQHRGTWEQTRVVTLFGGAREVARASYKLVVTSYSNANGAMAVAGYMESTGRTPGYGQFSTRAFSHVGLKIAGGADIQNVQVSWGPSMTTGASGTETYTYDPVTLHVLDKAGKEKRREELMSAVLHTKGAGKLTHWRGDGEFSIDADEAELEVKLPSSLTRDRGNLKLAVKGGAVTSRAATGALASSKLPAVGARTRLAAGAPAAAQKVAQKSSTNLKLDLTVPKLGAGEKFELRLGGGGSHVTDD